MTSGVLSGLKYGQSNMGNGREGLSLLVINPTYNPHIDFTSTDPYRGYRMLGHTNINMTAVYLRFNDQDLQEIYERVSGVPGP